MANKYTDEMVEALDNFASKYDAEIPYADVSSFVDTFNEQFGVEFNQRSIAGKLRYMGYKLAKKTSTTVKSYTEAEEDTIREMCSDLDNLPSMEEVADAVGKSCKSIGGKLVSMNIYGVKKANPVANDSVKLFTPEDEAVIVDMVNAPGDTFVEDIAEALGKEVMKVRGKLAGMRIKGVLTRNKKGKASKLYTDELLDKIQALLDEDKTLEEIADEFELKLTGLKSILAKKGLIAKSTKNKFWTDERKDELADLVEEGSTRENAADAMGTTVAVIAKMAKAMNLEFSKED